MVQRPNRVLAEVTGDDGSDKLVFDGKTLVICWSGTGFRAALRIGRGGGRQVQYLLASDDFVNNPPSRGITARLPWATSLT